MLSAPLVFEPAVAIEPVQPPDAVQAVALLVDQVSVELLPLVTLLGLAVRVMLGAVAATVTVAVCDAEPPVPVQVSMKFVVAVKVAVLCEPLVANAPFQPPDAVQLCASVVFHDSVTEWPTVMLL